MKKLLVIMLVGISFAGFAQRQGVGLRLGDPSGITYKKFYNRQRAVEFGIGSIPAQWHNSYYVNSFDEYGRYDAYRYQNHNVESTIFFQARYLFHYNIPVENLTGVLNWYWGGGGVMKFAKVRYRYQNYSDPGPVFPDTHTDVDFGPEGIAGLEYTFPDIPLSVFGETSLLFEIVNRPAAVRAYGALGLRYNFRDF